MNIAIKNENTSVMNSLDVEIIKTLDGSFTKEEIINNLTNLYYNKVVLDITAIQNYYDENTLFDFLSYFGPSKVVLVLNNTELCNNPLFLKKLIENGYYNFAKNAAGINFLMNRPNTFEDVKKYLEGQTMYNPMNQNEITAEENYNVYHNQNQKIIGIKNLTPHAGATTLMYMMLKILKSKFKVKGIECQKNDGSYFKSSDIISCENLESLKIIIKTLYTLDILIIDLNNLDGEEICDDIIYLMEAGTIKLNKFLKSNPKIGEFSKNHKIIISRNTISDKDLIEFSFETKINVFANIKDFNERDVNNKDVELLLNKLGFKV